MEKKVSYKMNGIMNPQRAPTNFLNTMNQAYFDPVSKSYYTRTNPMNEFYSNLTGMDFSPTAINNWLMQTRPGLYDALTKNRASMNPPGFGQQAPAPTPYQYNAPTAQQMFGNVSAPTGGMTMPNFGAGNQGGLFGAGRFLGGNYANQSGLLGTSRLGT